MAQQTSFPLLPRLKKGDKNKVRNFENTGVWNSREAIELDNLSESLDIEKIDPNYFDIDCIPDMWARPLLFEMALYDTNHLLHRRILGEWRGLLAMLALKEWRGLTLKVMPVDIPKSADAAKTAQTSLDFLGALGELAPHRELSDDTSWHQLYVILFGGEPIGMTSPTTLVCTAAYYFNRIKPIVTWFDGQFLFNPTPKLSQQEKKALSSWLTQLKSHFLQHQVHEQSTLESLIKQFKKEDSGSVQAESETPIQNDPRQQINKWNLLLGLLNQFQKDLGGDLNAQNTQFALSPNGFGMKKGIFQHLDKPVEKGKSESHVRLLPSRKEAPSPPLLVVDKAIPEQWGMPDYEVVVWETTTIASLDSLKLPPGVQRRSPADFFTDKLFVINRANAFPGAMKIRGTDTLQHQNQNLTPILPIKDELLNYLPPDDLRERVRFEQSDEDIVVKLQLPLSGPDNTGKDFEIQRKFSWQTNEVISISNVPVLEVWPNFNASTWKAYYTYFSTAGQQNTFYAKPYAPGYVLNEQENVQTSKVGGEIEREMTLMEPFPEAMICTAQEAVTQNNRIKLVPAGVLLIKQPDELTPATKSWTIGIDFGTTGTSVYVNDHIRSPFPIHFKPLLLQVTQSLEEFRSQIYDDFLPGATESTPFLSVFHKFPTVGLRPLLDGHIYFLPDYQKFSEKLTSDQGIITDLKWGGPDERRHVRAFLEQLCLQCAAEAVANGVKEVGWRFSFPAAFSDQDRKDFQDIWDKIAQACTNKTGLAQIQDSFKSEPESVVSARFFAECPDIPPARKALFNTGVVCIDIGGGTSDISVWQKNRLCWQASLLFAGRNLFLDLLYAKPNFLANLSTVDLSSLNRFKESHNRKEFYAQADALIKAEGDKWLENLPYDREKVKEFAQLMTVGLSGLFYYTGLLLQYLHQASTYEKRMPNVYVAGNGAKMFRWLESNTDEFFKKIFLKASGFEEEVRRFEVWISPSPKSEAAFGLVSEGVHLQYDENAQGFLAGEAFIENGNRCEWSEILTAERLTRGLEVPSKLEKIEDFVHTFNTFAPSIGVAIIETDVDLMNRIRDSLSEELARSKYAEKAKVRIQPLFVYALKTLLEIKIHEWASDTSVRS
ncbi:hypothetical protein HYR99_06610 [Candidatus Poribacteria bacterium]|nr:hypothetical protein [Candidatus Poribacteria bacterium]